MRIVEIRHASVPISRFADPALPSGGLDTSVVAVATDAVRDGHPVVGYGFGSIGRFAQDGLIRDRFAPRLLRAETASILTEDGANLDPFRAWDAMMAGEKPGGHGERCVAVGTLDMAIWDAAAKIARQPLYRFLSERLSLEAIAAPDVPVYAGGGYYYPDRDIERLSEEICRLTDLGYSRVKIKIGAKPLIRDLQRVEAALRLVGPDCLAVDAMNAYDAKGARSAAAALAPFGLWWFEDICDPLDFETLASVAQDYGGAIAAGEALFSDAEARLLDAHGGLRRDKDILLFDPVHCYGIPGYLRVVHSLEDSGWPRRAFWPHGGHLFCLHLVRALGLGGAEVNPLCFQPFGGLCDGVKPVHGRAAPPDATGIGFETQAALHRLFKELVGP
jgi:L-alanine-DL-glutamate epimerase-like enolase superfamily enzyme